MTTIYGYWRCSTNQQDEERQIRSLTDSGCEVLYGDKITGTSTYGERPELSKLLEVIKEGDILTNKIVSVGLKNHSNAYVNKCSM